MSLCPRSAMRILGEKIHIWDDHWVPNHPVLSPYSNSSSLDCTLVKHLFKPGTSEWDPIVLASLFTQTQIPNLILALRIPNEGSDNLKWSLTDKGDFTTFLYLEKDLEIRGYA
ncbi:hypothetical protein BVC80_8915g19 [Macleaya cordata]|uniref:Uncharacterized protein n=1 Tax=Macleaya cordata TaxID=56857 RepID=A0A200QFV9_MACCD|nr:hypothetical protein BVC80_8915g19 [Macleaya cordata]